MAKLNCTKRIQLNNHVRDMFREFEDHKGLDVLGPIAEEIKPFFDDVDDVTDAPDAIPITDETWLSIGPQSRATLIGMVVANLSAKHRMLEELEGTRKHLEALTSRG